MLARGASAKALRQQLPSLFEGIVLRPVWLGWVIRVVSSAEVRHEFWSDDKVLSRAQ